MAMNTEPFAMISELSCQSKNVNISFKILNISDSRIVRGKSTGQMHRVANAIVGDSSGIIILNIWDNQLDELNIGKSYLLYGGFVSVYEGSIRLNIGRNGELIELNKSIESINESLNMSQTSFMIKKRRNRNSSRTGRSLCGRENESKGYCSRKEF